MVQVIAIDQQRTPRLQFFSCTEGATICTAAPIAEYQDTKREIFFRSGIDRRHFSDEFAFKTSQRKRLHDVPQAGHKREAGGLLVRLQNFSTNPWSSPIIALSKDRAVLECRRVEPALRTHPFLKPRCFR